MIQAIEPVFGGACPLVAQVHRSGAMRRPWKAEDRRPLGLIVIVRVVRWAELQWRACQHKTVFPSLSRLGGLIARSNLSQIRDEVALEPW